MKFMEILVRQGRRQGASQGGSFSAWSVDLERRGVALPLDKLPFVYICDTYT